MSKKSLLALQDGTVYHGESFGAEGTAYGEVVFATSMAGYQEMLTDPSFAGQIVVPTYPLIGNYGTNPEDVESNHVQVRGFVVRECCEAPSHWRHQTTLHEYLLGASVPGLSGIDTRSLTRRLRSAGVMPGIVSTELSATEALGRLSSMPDYGSVDYVKAVSVTQAFEWEEPGIKCPEFSDSYYLSSAVRPHIVVVDFGTKYNILRTLCRLGCKVTVVPCDSSAVQVMAYRPDGIMLTPGPGDPAVLKAIVRNVADLLDKAPIMGICLGHQLIARALGASTFKLKFGHRGANHPVRDLDTGRIYITAQNHGYTVDSRSLPSELEVTHINLNDETVEGLRHRELPVFSIQYHSEASPGPRDNLYMFENFLRMVGTRSRASA
jgi:carbamoyl-phosphate synthase small subunit